MTIPERGCRKTLTISAFRVSLSCSRGSDPEMPRRFENFENCGVSEKSKCLVPSSSSLVPKGELLAIKLSSFW